MNTLYLTTTEQALYIALPEALREGWVVEEEHFSAYETPTELELRWRMADFGEPLTSLAQSAKQATSEDDISRILATFDITELSQPQLAELFFVLGARITTYMIRYLLTKCDSDEDMEGLVSLTMIRHLQFETNLHIAS